MPIRQLYSIRDVKTHHHHDPVCSNFDDEAKREFQQGILSEKTLMHSYPEDFVLVRLGVLDTMTGALQSLSTPEVIYTGTQALADAQKRSGSKL